MVNAWNAYLMVVTTWKEECHDVAAVTEYHIDNPTNTEDRIPPPYDIRSTICIKLLEGVLMSPWPTDLQLSLQNPKVLVHH